VKERRVYVYAHDAAAAYQILLTRTRGWKKGRGVISLAGLSSEEGAALEAAIQASGDVPLAKVMNDGFCYQLRLGQQNVSAAQKKGRSD
jgi:hypothetical protein